MMTTDTMATPGITPARRAAAMLGVAIAAVLGSSCASNAPPATTIAPAAAGATGARSPAPPPLVGHVKRATVENYATWKALRAQDYTPDTAAVRTIRARGKGVTVLLILGTWCPDSKREVPRFFKIFDQARINIGTVTMVGVDRTKKDAEGLTVKHSITRVPTFVFFRNNEEIGRVTERATTTLEKDIAAILAR